MEINVLDKDLNLIGVVDDFISLMWCKRYYDVGAIDLEIEASKKNIELLKQNYYITRNDDDAIYRINSIEIDDKESNSLIVGAVDCKNILTQRVIWEKIVFSGTVEDYIRLLITNNIIEPKLQLRQIDTFVLDEKKGFEEEITQQVSFENLGEKIIEICKMYKYGSRVYFKDKKFYFDLYKGQDKTLTFSNELDNLLSSKYNLGISGFKNCALIVGEGEGEEQTITNVGSSSGLDRFEMLVEDSESKDDLTDISYLNKLKSKGYEELAKNSVTTKIEGEVDFNFYTYKQDYNLGDIVTITNEFGISTKARITEIIETWDNDGYSLEPKFEYDEFKITESSGEMNLVLVATYNKNTTNPITLNKSDFPYGLYIEIQGGKGSDGKGGNLDTYVDGGDFISGSGGKGGEGGDDVTVSFTVDNVSYTATALGGGGGGGGCGVYSTELPISTGGKGGYGEGLTLDVVFENSVVINNIDFVTSGKDGKQPERSRTPLRTLYRFYSAGGDSGMGDKAYQENIYVISNGADCVTLRSGATTNYSNFSLANNTDENNHIVKIYKWERTV